MVQKQRTLAFDIGGTAIKCQVVDPSGEPIGPHETRKTPRPATPQFVINELVNLAQDAQYDRISLGFPGLVRVSDGVILTAPNLDGGWRGFELAHVLGNLLKRPIRVAKDADIHGFGAVSGEGVELLLTLGTGLGSALFVDGFLVPNVDLAHHTMRLGFTYEQVLGKRALEQWGKDAWQVNLRHAIDQLQAMFNCHTLYLGGGHAALVEGLSLPSNVRIVSNDVALHGSVALWDCKKAPSNWRFG